MSEHYCMYKDGMCELDIDEAYQQGRADAKEELFNQISEILSVEMADCKTCPIGSEVNTFGGCQEEIKKYLLEQIS